LSEHFQKVIEKSRKRGKIDTLTYIQMYMSAQFPSWIGTDTSIKGDGVENSCMGSNRPT